MLAATGRFRAEVLPEDGDGEWRELTEPDDIVEFYDPTDVFGDLADALAEAFPGIAPELAEDEDDEDEGDEDEGDDGRSRGRRGRARTRPRTSSAASRLAAPSAVEAAARPCAPPAPSSSRRREILPGQWLLAWHAPALVVRRARRPVRPRPDGGERAACRSAARIPIATADAASGTLTIQVPAAAMAPGHGPAGCGPVIGRTSPDRSGARSRWTRARATCCSWPRARDRRPPPAHRRGDPGRPLGGAPVRRRARRRTSTRPACSRTRSSTSWRRTTAAWAIVAPSWTSSWTTRRGPTRRSRPDRPRSSAGSPPGDGPAPAPGRRDPRPQAWRGQASRPRLRGGAAQGLPPGGARPVDRLRGRHLPRMRGDGGVGDNPAGVPRGPGVRGRRAGLGGRIVTPSGQVDPA